MKAMQKRQFYSVKINLAVNLLYALYNGILGCVTYSWWLITLAAYYIILGIMQFSAILCSIKNKGNRHTEYFIMRFSGFMFLVLSVVLIGTVYMTVEFDVGVKYHEIVMITIALYAFTKITLAIIKFIKYKRNNSPIITTIRSIALADAVVSIFSLQRSMLVSFDGMSPENITLFNTLTGIAVCLIVIILGINMIKKENEYV